MRRPRPVRPVREGVHPLGQPPVRAGSGVVNEGDLVRPSGAQVALDQIVGGVVLPGDGDPWRAHAMVGEAQLRHLLLRSVLRSGDPTALAAARPGCRLGFGCRGSLQNAPNHPSARHSLGYAATQPNPTEETVELSSIDPMTCARKLFCRKGIRIPCGEVSVLQRKNLDSSNRGFARRSRPCDARSLCWALLQQRGFSQPAHAIVIEYSAVLTGQAESPPTGSDGSGFVTVIIDTDLHTMAIEASFTGLGAPTTVAHIHCCTAAPESGNVGVATTTPTFPGFPAGVTSGMYAMTFDLLAVSSYNMAFINGLGGGTVAGAEAALLAGLDGGQAYFNVHTEEFQAGRSAGLCRSSPSPRL